MKGVLFMFLFICTLYSGRAGVDQPRLPSNETDDCTMCRPSIIPILSTIDYAELQRLIHLRNDDALLRFYTPIARQIAGYVWQQYNEDVLADILSAPETGMILALFLYGKEMNILPPDRPDPGRDGGGEMNCFTAALGGLIGIPEIKGIYSDFVSGRTSPKTVIKAVKLIGRRVATIIGVAIAVYSLGDCLEWW
ncbi:MAG: hypothetical protein H7Y31_02820 [Chitinophagaceae bacterium]|nr:hypothetical protein [Chitinophagaceae bacterium]